MLLWLYRFEFFSYTQPIDSKQAFSIVEILEMYEHDFFT